jgi:hypothetical protein
MFSSRDEEGQEQFTRTTIASTYSTYCVTVLCSNKVAPMVAKLST